MKYTETLDHAPAAVELERLPDGTAWLRLHKDVVQGKTEAPEGEEGGPCWTATTAVAQLGRPPLDGNPDRQIIRVFHLILQRIVIDQQQRKLFLPLFLIFGLVIQILGDLKNLCFGRRVDA